MDKKAYIYDCLRTPRARAKEGGTLADVPPQELVSQLIAAIDQRCDSASERAGQLVLGCVGQVGAQGGNIALLSRLHAGLADSVPAYSLNNFCVSSLTAIGNSANAVTAGALNLALAGGVEHMSRVPFMADKAHYYSDATLPPRARFLPVALAADLLATQEDIPRGRLDELTAQSHERAAQAAIDNGLSASLVPVRGKGDDVLLASDECIRPDSTPEGLGKLSPAFAELAEPYREAIAGRALEHRHSIANAPGMVDGAALALVGGAGACDVRPRARIVAVAEASADPAESLTGGFAAMQRVLALSGASLPDFDRIELMEAFAVVPALFYRDYEVDPAKVNVGGGHLAKGHPMGATGAVLVSSLLDALGAADGSLGLVVATGASGVGAAMVLERMS